MYYKDAVGAFLLFDVTRNDSFKAVEKWKSDLDDKGHKKSCSFFRVAITEFAFLVLLPDGRPIPCVLVGNKCDMPRTGQVANDAAMESFAKVSVSGLPDSLSTLLLLLTGQGLCGLVSGLGQGEHQRGRGCQGLGGKGHGQ